MKRIQIFLQFQNRYFIQHIDRSQNMQANSVSKKRLTPRSWQMAYGHLLGNCIYNIEDFSPWYLVFHISLLCTGFFFLWMIFSTLATGQIQCPLRGGIPSFLDGVFYSQQVFFPVHHCGLSASCRAHKRLISPFLFRRTPFMLCFFQGVL